MGTRDLRLPRTRPFAVTKMLQTRRLRWRTALTYAIIIALLMVGLFYFLSFQLNKGHVASLEAQFQAQARAAAAHPALIDAWDEGNETSRALLQDWAALFGARATLFDADGYALADSHLAVQEIDDTLPRPELSEALATGMGRSVRIDPVTGESVAYLAFPVLDGDKVVGAIRWAYPLTSALADVVQMRRILIWSLLVVALVIIGMLVVQFERSAYTVRQLTAVANRIRAGELDARVVSISGGDIGELTRSFNRMAGKLENQIRKRGREKDRLNTVLHVMADGVIMVNRKGKVRIINPAAARILQTSESDALKRSFVQAVRDHRIAEVWKRCKESGQQEVSGIELSDQRYLRVVVTPYLRGTARGYLIMMQDLSRMRRLQTVRQDFVSNVSHDLRTPLAALRALVETLRDGALDDPPAAQRFLSRMEGEVDSLTQLVEELLTLSRIESGQVPLRIEAIPAAEIVRRGAERLRPQAERLDIELILDLPDDLPAVMVDASRVQQVVTNLVHNAVKFTPSGGTITVSAEAIGEVVTVVVHDTGVGIPTGDLPRIFERFYKTDRARSGGGTGLGLAIAKHVVQAHDGEIWAESVEGKGSTFSFSLPVARREDDPAAAFVSANALDDDMLHDGRPEDVAGMSAAPENSLLRS